ncbi:MAG: hypothetical protein CVV52_02330 [Spirochaetae bacterium HGW-Spirochaetae-8]|jgi:hypothetical protein|nr:MAG: hypothetical protein CVV52_02330 [Spirochaetae bacterium HGW-Spirochaetae-8]
MAQALRLLSVLICISFLIILCSCEQEHYITVVLAQDHPWETASGRRFWYTLVWNALDGEISKTHLSIGCRSVRVPVVAGQSVVFAAYPLGTGIPLGGSYLAIDKKETVSLTVEEGPLADMLLSLSKRWPAPVARVNTHRLVEYIEAVDPLGIGIDWNILAKSIVEGDFSSTQVRGLQSIELVLDGLPEGRWVCEHAGYPALFGYCENPVVIKELFPGLLRYVNMERDMELRLVVSEDAITGQPGGSYWHVVAIDPLFTLSDAAYQQMLELE